ncbi:class I SAM-dependent methyltransferase [Gammaproteobacteria bacterium]|nr:class I SAM-dependent methyltransferase [Gammaproteobacteria bacterium]
MDNWPEIWNKRKPVQKDLSLEDLIKLDGFDSGAGIISVQDWQKNCRIIANKLGLSNGMSVYEVGCGSGAFLKSLLEMYNLDVGGIDYAKELLNTAKKLCQVVNLNVQKHLC